MANIGLLGPQQTERNQEATVWIGGLEPQSTEELIWELMLQAGRVVSVNMPRDKVTNTHQGYAFCEFRTPDDAEYAIRIMNNVKLFGKPIRVNKASRTDKLKEQEFAANLFVGNLDTEVDDNSLLDTFTAFGPVLYARVMYDEQGKHRGFGFVSMETFEAADAAIAAMNGSFFGGRNIQVSYAYKKDGSKGERHGSEAERELARQASLRKIRAAGGRLPPPPPVPTRVPTFGLGMPMPPPLPFGRPPLPPTMSMAPPVPTGVIPPSLPPHLMAPPNPYGAPAAPMYGAPPPQHWGYPPAYPGYPPM